MSQMYVSKYQPEIFSLKDRKFNFKNFSLIVSIGGVQKCSERKKNYVDVANLIGFHALLILKLGNCKGYYSKQLKKKIK